MQDDILIIDKTRSVLRLTINRPAARNALNEELMRALTQAFAAVEGDVSIRAVLLTGAGDKAFCAGADLGASSKTLVLDYARPTTTYGNLMRTARAVRVPIVGRIDGVCLAGGMGL